METEIWKPVVGYEGLYEVNNLGTINSLNYNHTKEKKIIKDRHSIYGYKITNLWKKGIVKTYSVHRIVGYAFIQNPENKLQINHKNGVKDDNRVENLEWCTHGENQLHKYRVLGHKQTNSILQTNHPYKGKFGNHLSKKVYQYNLSLELIKVWGGTHEVARGTKFKQSNISACCRGIQKTAGGFIWKYYNIY